LFGQAQQDPAGAARTLAQLGNPVPHASTAYMIAGEWARQDPAAAAAWVVEQGTDPSLASSFRRVAEVWVQDAPAAALQWVLSLPSGAMRDSALDGLLSRMAAAGVLDANVLAEYSSDDARQRAAMQVIMDIGAFDPRQASHLMEQHLTDPMVRRMVTEEIERRQQPGLGQFRGLTGGPR
jgi:alkylation response protein AidB-like acyl-CoA dehydrogenase